MIPAVMVAYPAVNANNDDETAVIKMEFAWIRHLSHTQSRMSSATIAFMTRIELS